LGRFGSFLALADLVGLAKFFSGTSSLGRGLRAPRLGAAADGLREGLLFEESGTEVINLIRLRMGRRRRFLTSRPFWLTFWRTLGPAALRAIFTALRATFGAAF
jgi:hypothetical protein